jgi:hypothetical protein
VDVLSGYRRRAETKAEARGWQDSWCVPRRSVHRVVHPAVVIRVRIQGRLVSVPSPVWILVRNVLAQIARLPILPVSGEKKQAGVRKGALLVEQFLQDGQTPGRLVSAGPFDRQMGRSAGQSADWDEAFLKSEMAAWCRSEPRVLAAPLSVSLAAHQIAFRDGLRCAPGHRSFAVHESFLPRLVRTRAAGNCGAKDMRAVLVCPAAMASATPC